MKTIGLIGGMSWESTIPYYRIINETVKERLGGLHSAKIVLYSVDFAEVEHMQRTGKWDAAGRLLADAARSLENAGADFLVLCANTMHKVASAIEAAVAIPLLHIADPLGRAITSAGHRTVGLLGTQFTMEQAFYTDYLRDRHGLRVLVPEQADRELVHRVIYDELCRGRVVPDSRAEYRRIMADLAARGAEAIILGCTEISLLVGADDATVPLFDTTAIHARSAAELALAPADSRGAAIVGVHHVQLAMPPGGEESARSFYAGVLGIAEVPKPANLAKRGGVWFETAAVRVHLGVEADHRPARKAHPGFLVASLEQVVGRLRKAGYEVTDGEPLDGYVHAYVDDPFGNRIELLERR